MSNDNAVNPETKSVPSKMLPEPEKTDQPVKVDEPADQDAPSKEESWPKGYVPHEALQDERIARKKLQRELQKKEDRLAELESSAAHSEFDSDTEYSEEGKVLKREISELHKKLSRVEEQRQLDSLMQQYPVLKDHSEEFDEFKEDYVGIDTAKVARLFLAERGYLHSAAPKREGLERATGPGDTPAVSKVSRDDIKRLREEQPRKYIQMIREGAIDPENIE